MVLMAVVVVVELLLTLNCAIRIVIPTKVLRRSCFVCGPLVPFL